VEGQTKYFSRLAIACHDPCDAGLITRWHGSARVF